MTNIQYGSCKSGACFVSGNRLHYKVSGESVTTTIEIESGHRFSASVGYYYQEIIVNPKTIEYEKTFLRSDAPAWFEHNEPMPCTRF